MKVSDIFKKFKTEIMVFAILFLRMLYNRDSIVYSPAEYAAFAVAYLFIAFVAGRFVSRFGKENKTAAELFAAFMSLAYCVTFEVAGYRQFTIGETGTEFDMGLHFTTILFFASLACLCVSKLAWLSVVLSAGAMVIDLGFAAMYMPALVAAAYISCSNEGIELTAGKRVYDKKNQPKSIDRFVVWALLAELLAVVIYYFAIDVDPSATSYLYDKFFLGDQEAILNDTYVKNNYALFFIPVAFVGILLPVWWSKLKEKRGCIKAAVGFAAFFITCFNAYLFDFYATHAAYYTTAAIMGSFLTIMIAVIRKDTDFQKSISHFFSKYGTYFVSAATVVLFVLSLINYKVIGGK